MSTQLVIVSISGRRLAIDLDDVEEVAGHGAVTALPRLPASIRGVVDIRGNAVPLIDLDVLDGNPPRAGHRSVIVATDGIRPIAILIDEVEQIAERSEIADHDEVPPLDLRGIMERIA